MTDTRELVERLRQWDGCWPTPGLDHDVERAADTITALSERVRVLEEAMAEASDPDFIWGALDNVHDAETTLDDYAAAVSRAIRAALAGGRG